MRIIINVLLVVLTLGLLYLLVTSIREPIQFKTEKERRERQVIDRLMEIRQAQEMFVDIYGEYAKSPEDLKTGLDTGQFMYIKFEGDPDDPNFEDFQKDTSYTPAIDSVRSIGIPLDSLPYIPFAGGERFEYFADTLQYESSLVNVVEVGTQYKTFMGRFADPAYARYDDSYDPNKTIKFGDRTKPVVTGNWER